MELIFSLAALGAFSLFPAGAPILLRCGLTACLRFSPRAALALSSLTALSCCAAMLACRGGLRAVPESQRSPVAAAAFLGSTLSRMLLLMFVSRFSGSLALARLQAVPLLLLSLVAAFPRRFHPPRTRSGLFAFSLLCAFVEGFFGCGSAALFLFFGHSGICRRRISLPGAALLLCLTAQCSALLLTWLAGASEIFPFPLLLALISAAALGSAAFEKTKKRSPIKTGLRIVLLFYTCLAALAGTEQAFFQSFLIRTAE